jgi:hypothetical protein
MENSNARISIRICFISVALSLFSVGSACFLMYLKLSCPVFFTKVRPGISAGDEATMPRFEGDKV